MGGDLKNLDNVSGTISTIGSVTGTLSTPKERVLEGDYTKLKNKPSIEGVALEDDKTFKQLGLDTLSVQEIEKILYLD